MRVGESSRWEEINPSAYAHGQDGLRASAPGVNLDVLVQLVRHDVMPANTEALTTQAPVLSTEAAPLTSRAAQSLWLPDALITSHPEPGK